jgi:activating signal cointegrator complex subunit 3
LWGTLNIKKIKHNISIFCLCFQTPIESSFIKSLADHLNAEIVNGTVSNVRDAATWLSYTFLFVCMMRNPVAYGMTHEERYADPQLEQKRVQLVKQAAETLDNCMMARFDQRSGNLAVSEWMMDDE